MMFLTSSSTDKYQYTTHIKIWGVRFYITNRNIARNNLDDISHHGYSMGYADTTVFILYWNPDHTFSIHIPNHDWFGEYNNCLFIEDNHTPGFLLLQQDPENILHY